MRINNNLMAMNTHRQLGVANDSSAKSIEKLSSGYRINRAGDDAAGLAISEKMRGQIRGLNQASANAQDGISLIQTTEGALNETHAILQRMRELAVQSSTDTNTDSDRAELQKEVDQLAQEITRISTDTEFNTMKLLDGSFKGKKFHIGANTQQNTGIDVADMSAKALGVIRGLEAADTGATASEGKAATIALGNVRITAVEDGIASNGIEIESADGAAANTALSIAVTDATYTANGTLDDAANIAVTLATNTDGDAISTAEDIANAINAHAAASKLVKAEVTKIDRDTDGTVKAETEVTTAVVLAGGVDAVEGIDVKALEEENSELGINISTQGKANSAITTINDALERVSSERSKLGAMQNRLEHTIKNLDTSAENLQASESRIRDVDMAKEMMEQTKQNILAQASTAMLAQANQAPQAVLQLLR